MRRERAQCFNSKREKRTCHSQRHCHCLNSFWSPPFPLSYTGTLGQVFCHKTFSPSNPQKGKRDGTLCSPLGLSRPNLHQQKFAHKFHFLHIPLKPESLPSVVRMLLLGLRFFHWCVKEQLLPFGIRTMGNIEESWILWEDKTLTNLTTGFISKVHSAQRTKLCQNVKGTSLEMFVVFVSECSQVSSNIVWKLERHKHRNVWFSHYF